MIRFYLRTVLILLILFVIVPLLIHTQPYDKRTPSAVLIPVNCRPPCFMGIRPGVTTIEQAISLLKKNEWVSQVVALSNTTPPNDIGWTWSEKAPAYLQRGIGYVDGRVLPGMFTNGKVGWIGFDTTLTMGDIPLIMGDPKEDGLLVNGLYLAPDPKMRLSIEFWFPTYHLLISGSQICPYDTGVWQLEAHVAVTYDDPRRLIRTMPVQPVLHTNLMPSLHSLSQQVCGF